MGEVKLTKAQVDTLREMAGYSDWPRMAYVFRPKTSASLVALRLAEIAPGEKGRARPYHLITDAGRTWLKDHPNG